MALRRSSLTPKPRWPAEEGWPAAPAHGLPEGFQDAPHFLDADIFEAAFKSLAGCAAFAEGQAAAVPHVGDQLVTIADAAHVDGPKMPILELSSPGRHRGGGPLQGDHASKGPPAPLSLTARGHMAVAKRRLLTVQRQTASLRLGYANLAKAWNAGMVCVAANVLILP